MLFPTISKGGGGTEMDRVRLNYNIHLMLSRFQACIIRLIAQVPEVKAQLALCVMLANNFENGILRRANKAESID